MSIRKYFYFFLDKSQILNIIIQINENGEILETKIHESLGNNGCDEAATKAIKSVKWKPAQKGAKPITAWVSVPVKFRLNGGKRKTVSEGHKENEKIKIDVPPPPYYPPSEQFKDDKDTFVFVPYDDPPQPIGGFDAIQIKVYYPGIAHKAGVEGKVVIYAKVGSNGEIIDARVVKPLGNSGCNEAAIQAIKSVQWKPAMHTDQPVTVWVSVPVEFKLKK